MSFTLLEMPRRRDRASLADHLGALARQALIAEAELTPKPGLVDRRGSGAHRDLTLEMIRRSAIAIEPWFARMAAVSAGRDIDRSLREELAELGRAAERAMYQATRGCNTHKGAIWTLGLLTAAAARNESQVAEEIASTAGALARLPDRPRPALFTHGDFARVQYGAAGARGEAANDFPHLMQIGLPTLRRHRAAGDSQEIARLNTLVAVMAQLDDTCILYRGGPMASALVRYGAQAVVAAGGCGTARGRQQLRQLDGDLLAGHLSPGGSADLLAATMFLDVIERGQPEVTPDQNDEAMCHGTASV